jgi:hypothetical protein
MTLAQKLYETACVQTFAPMQPWERLDPVFQVAWEAIADVATIHLSGSDASVSAARSEALLDLARDLVAAVQAERADRKDFEFSTAEAQERKRRTTRLLNRMKAAIEEAGGE